MQESLAQEGFDANMFVPIDLLEPVLEDMIELGRPRRTPRPWLGLYTAEQGDHILVAGLTRDGPAHRAGVRLGDIIVEAAGHRVTSLPQFFRAQQCAIRLHAGAVMRRSLGDHRQVVVGRLAHQPGRRAHHYRAVGDFAIRRHQ